MGHLSACLKRLLYIGAIAPIASQVALAQETGTLADVTPGINQHRSNWAFSPSLAKFVDSLPGLGPRFANNLGVYIPIAKPKANPLFPNDDYYELGLRDYNQLFHTDLSSTPTRMRGYVDLNGDIDPNTGTQYQSFLGPLILARRDKPVRIKFSNLLPKSNEAGANLFVPVDTTYMGAGLGPTGQMYTENRFAVHLHGGYTPWISDGTPHQWITPAGDPAAYKKGVSLVNVPDMADPGDGAMTLYYPNQQSARLMFYHDHTQGLTRLNPYVGEAAGYLLTDAVEDALIDAGILPGSDLPAEYRYGIPLILADKTFIAPLVGTGEEPGNPERINDPTVSDTDPTWNRTLWGGTGSLWFPHAYMINQDPGDPSGVNPFGRWDYGPFSFPISPAAHDTIPTLSGTPESYFDTVTVNGAAYPYLTLEPRAYRFRILNACNDRFMNLQLYKAKSNSLSDVNSKEVDMVPAEPTEGFPAAWPVDGRDGGVPNPASIGPSMIEIGTEGGFLPAPTVIAPQPVTFTNDERMPEPLVKDHSLLLGCAERADVVVDLTSCNPGDVLILYNDAPAPIPGFDPRLDYYTGNPDLTSSGGNVPTLAGFGPNTRTIMQIRIVAPTKSYSAYNLSALEAALPTAFAASQPTPIIPEPVYGPAYGTTFSSHVVTSHSQSSITFTPVGSATPVTLPILPKSIEEPFDPEYGRGTANLGVVDPYSDASVPVGYINAPTEIIPDGSIQVWRITHRGVDTHPIHFHLVNVQVINRIHWDGTVGLPEPNEQGWKETVRMNPLEDTVVAMTAAHQVLPFGVPPSVRVLDPSRPENATVPATSFGTTAFSNVMTNFGWEYVWHCHILGHEESDMMRPMVLQVPTTTIPTAPSGVHFVSAGTGKIGVAWTDNSSNEWSFRVERAPVVSGVTGTYALMGTVPPNTTSFVDSVSAGTTYKYRVESVNQAGISTPSPVATLAAPTTPVIGSATNVADTPTTALSIAKVQITWTPGTGQTGFIVTRASGSANNAPTASFSVDGANASSYVDTTAQPNVYYIYRVIGTNAVGNSASSAYKAVTTPGRPATPTLTLVTTDTTIKTGTTPVTVQFKDNSTNETGFVVERATDASFTQNLTHLSVAAVTGSGSTVTFSDTTAQPGTRYYYQVMAVNGSVSSSYDGVGNATTAGAPKTPFGLVFVSGNVKQTQAQIYWNPGNTNFQGAYIEKSTDGVTFNRAAVITGGTYITWMTGLNPGTTYYFRVQNYNGFGVSGYSNVVSGTTLP